MKLYDLRVNHLERPLGFEMRRVHISWKVCEALGKQQAARIRLASTPSMTELLWDSGNDPSLSSLASPRPIDLKPRTRYYYTVEVRSDQGETAVSEPEYFETGKRDEAWEARWISCDSKETRHPCFIRDIKLQAPVQSARLYICGLGLYEAYWNGEKIGDEYLTPFSNNYGRWLQVQSYDVGAQLTQSGRLSVMLGNGWYKGRFGFTAREEKGYYGDSWKLIAELRIRYADGNEEVIGTDLDWHVERSTITYSSLYDGEHMDALAKEMPPEAVRLCEAPKGKLSDRLSPYLRIHEQLKPVRLIRTPAHEQVLDLGQEITGLFTLAVRAPKGREIRIQTGEILQNGNFYNKNLRTAKSEYLYRSDGKARIIRPHFTFYGYRYVKIEGIDDLRADDFTALCLYSDVAMRGEIETGHALVNQLISNIRWGLKDNFLDVPTDCPQRDERMGWTADTQVFTAAACYLSDPYAFYAKYLHDLWTEQEDHGGMVPDVIPSAGVDSCSSVWGDAACIMPWILYTFSGDRAILEDQYASMKAWVDWIHRFDGNTHNWRRHFSYGDWLALDGMGNDPEHAMGATDEGFISNVYYAASAELVSRAASVLGKNEDAAVYAALSRQEFDAVRHEYYSPSGRCCIRTQTAMILTLIHHLSDNMALTKKTLLDLFNESEHKLQTGFTGTPLLANTLSENGFTDLAFELLLNEDYPGWLYAVKLGATTVWERWNALLPDGTISGTEMNSMNHYAYGSIVEWMFRHVAGIRQANGGIGFKKALIAPTYNWDLKHVKASYDSPAGRYAVEWAIKGEDAIQLSVTVPFDCEAELHLADLNPETLLQQGARRALVHADGVCHLQAGTYRFTYTCRHKLRSGLTVDLPNRRLFRHSAIKAYICTLMPHHDLPVEMRGKSLRDLLNKYQPNMGAEEIEAVNRKLNELAQISAS